MELVNRQIIHNISREKMWIILTIGITLFHGIECQCTFPTTLTGTWVSSNDGTWDINSTHILNYYSVSSTTGTTISPGVSRLNFECFENQGDTKYALKSEEFDLLGGQRSVYTCVDIRPTTDNKLVYYQATEADPSGFQFTVASDYDRICNLDSYVHPYNYHIALKSGTETTSLQNCPADLFGSYFYDTCIDVNSNSTSLDVCDSRQQLIFNYTLCNTPQMFTLEGVLDCVHHEESGSISYLTLYNRDSTTPDNTNYFRFVCLAVELSGGVVYVTASPNRCNDNQNTTAIASPGETLQLTSYFLCPFTTDSSSTNILPIIVGIVVAFLLLALIALIIFCCCRRKCKKKKTDEEQALSDSESEAEQQKKQDSRRSSKSSHEEDEENKSIDSGISEPPVTGRTDNNHELDGDTKEEERELVINSEGDKEVEDKNSRPCSGQQQSDRSRMSDLPPSTIPPEEDHFLSQRDEEDNINEEQVDGKESQSTEEPEHKEDVEDETDQNKAIENESAAEDEDGNNESEEGKYDEEVDDEEEGDEKEIEEQGEEEVEKEEEENDIKDENDMNESEKEDVEQEISDDINDNDDEKDDEKGADIIVPLQDKDIQNDDIDPEQTKEDTDEDNLEAETDKEDEPVQEDSDGDDAKSDDHEQTKEVEDTASQKVSDDETEARQVKQTSDSDDDETERERLLIGGKKGKDYKTGGGLTTVLVSREEEERKRQKINSKSKKQKMRKLAKKKTKKFGIKATKGEGNQTGSDDDFGSLDDEKRRRGLREAPFLKQYEDKKHIEHILDEQHYWSDPEADKDAFRIDDEMSSVFNSEFSSGSEEEVVGADGILVRVKKSKYDKRRKRGDGDDISNADSEFERLKMLKRAGSVDSMISVEDPETKDDKKSKRKLNEHVIRTIYGDDLTESNEKSTKTEDINGNQYNDKCDKDEQGGTGDSTKKSDTVAKTKLASKRTKTILVKEHSDMTDESVTEKERNYKNKKTLNSKENEGVLSDFCDTDIDKLSDRDSGMDDEDGDIDVLLTKDQQQMIVNMLFDEDMNLRPQFDRDDNGRIVRRLDNTVVYDPHTGRFTYRKRLGQIFKVPRLKRNDKGRPLGGYIEDEFGPIADQKNIRRITSSARRSQSGKSGRFSANTRSSSADLKRIRNDGRNVGFSVPDDEIDTIPDDDLEHNKRGRRDIGSAIRRQLNKRLFRKKRKHGSRGSPSALPKVKVRKAWGDDDHVTNGKLAMTGSGGMGQLNYRSSGRFGQGSPWAQRKTPAPGDAEQWQIYRDGLQSDRRILESLQDKLNTGEEPFPPKETFVESSAEENVDQEHHGHQRNVEYERGQSFFNEDGKLVIRERGCPELKQQKVPLFTIIRRPADLESSEHLNGTSTTREIKSAPLHVQDYNGEHNEVNANEGIRYTSDNSLGNRSQDGRYSQLTSIDDNRLRRLLEELYKDKKYFDSYVESKDPQSQEFLHSQGLAEHGRGYLLKRADYWERRGPLPPRPPMTAIGLKMQRQQTLVASRQASEIGYSTMTGTPDISNSYMPGVVESPRENGTISERNESRTNQKESFA